ncbi:hypothetical protein NPIL_415981 [Nephila pilipes]|uniref:Uncharacterized protein n=1 Tax=Nephila pilipes TaxID=299642 RepID=A0A8X6QV69_NEPPI|nr:hypothetical protein NPIL_415981 [Nephila pilipes]
MQIARMRGPAEPEGPYCLRKIIPDEEDHQYPEDIRMARLTSNQKRRPPPKSPGMRICFTPRQEILPLPLFMILIRIEHQTHFPVQRQMQTEISSLEEHLKRTCIRNVGRRRNGTSHRKGYLVDAFSPNKCMSPAIPAKLIS